METKQKVPIWGQKWFFISICSFAVLFIGSMFYFKSSTPQKEFEKALKSEDFAIATNLFWEHDISLEGVSEFSLEDYLSYELTSCDPVSHNVCFQIFLKRNEMFQDIEQELIMLMSTECMVYFYTYLRPAKGICQIGDDREECVDLNLIQYPELAKCENRKLMLELLKTELKRWLDIN